jgi:hypothetical protein
MATIVLKDPTVHPTDEIVFSFIGEKKVLWEMLHQKLNDEHKDISADWRYYNDGKSWLYRGLKKDKIIFWVGVFQDYFNVTFYLSKKAEELIANSELPVKMKQDFEDTKDQKFRAIQVAVSNEADIDNILKLVKIKLKVK